MAIVNDSASNVECQKLTGSRLSPWPATTSEPFTYKEEALRQSLRRIKTLTARKRCRFIVGISDAGTS